VFAYALYLNASQDFVMKKITGIFKINQELYYFDSLLITFYSSYMFRRLYVIIREPFSECPAELHRRYVQFVLYVKGSLHSAVAVTEILKYIYPDDFTVCISKLIKSHL
jgi:hypothetical protein